MIDASHQSIQTIPPYFGRPVLSVPLFLDDAEENIQPTLGSRPDALPVPSDLDNAVNSLASACLGQAVQPDLEGVIKNYWHPEKNAAVTPQDVRAQNLPFWWRCPIDSQHSAWRMRPTAFLEDANPCPFCSTQEGIAISRVCVLRDYWATTNPPLGQIIEKHDSQWSRSWACIDCDYEWSLSITAMLNRLEKGAEDFQPCPQCAPHKNAIVHHPLFNRIFLPEDNLGVNANEISYYDRTKTITWTCAEGHKIKRTALEQFRPALSGDRNYPTVTLCPTCDPEKKRARALTDEEKKRLHEDWLMDPKTLSRRIPYNHSIYRWKCPSGNPNHVWLDAPVFVLNGKSTCPSCAVEPPAKRARIVIPEN